MSVEEQFRKIQDEAFELFKRKNRDYGNAFAKHGVVGVMIRMSDKLDRFINLALKDGERAVKDESLRDTLIDFHNYAAMAIIALEMGEHRHEPQQMACPGCGATDSVVKLERGSMFLKAPPPHYGCARCHTIFVEEER